VGVVDHDPTAVLARGGDQPRQVDDVALHREHAVDDDERGLAGSRSSRRRRKSAASLWLNFTAVPKPRRAPSMMQAWSSLSR